MPESRGDGIADVACDEWGGGKAPLVGNAMRLYSLAAALLAANPLVESRDLRAL